MQKEQLEVKVTLSGTYWDKKPSYRISLADFTTTGVVEAETGATFDVVLNADLVEDQEYTLEIELLNKEDSDTVENADKTAIVKDLLLNIHDITVDGIRLGTLLWSHSEYIVNKFEKPVLRCVNLGWNGTWKFKFTSPFYIWFLENT